MRLFSIFFLTFLLAACSAQRPATSLTKEDLSSYLKAHPEVLVDALAQQGEGLLQIIEAANNDRQKNTFITYLNQSLKEPRLSPKMTPGRLQVGNPDAQTTIVVYSDFLCGHCRALDQVLQQYLSRKDGEVKVIPKFYPRNNNETGLACAVYVEALARIDSEKAWDLYHYLFANQEKLFKDPNMLSDQLKKMDLDLEQLKALATSKEIQQQILADMKEAKEFGLDGTPMMVINGVRVTGGIPLEWLEAAVEATNPS